MVKKYIKVSHFPFFEPHDEQIVYIDPFALQDGFSSERTLNSY